MSRRRERRVPGIPAVQKGRPPTWDTRLARSLVREVTSRLDLDAGLRDVLAQAQSDLLVREVTGRLDLDAGLRQIIPSLADTPSDDDTRSEDSKPEQSGPEQILREFAAHVSRLTPEQRIMLRRDRDSARLAADVRQAATIIDTVIEQRRDLRSLQDRVYTDTSAIALTLAQAEAGLSDLAAIFVVHAATTRVPAVLVDEQDHDPALHTTTILTLARKVLDAVETARALERNLAVNDARDLDLDRVLDLARVLDRDLVIARDLVRARARVLDRALVRDRDLDRAPGRDRARGLVRVRARARALVRVLDLARDLAHMTLLARALVREVDRARVLDLDRARGLVRAPDLAFDLARVLAGVLDLDLDLVRTHDVDRARGLVRARDLAFDLARDLGESDFDAQVRDLALALGRLSGVAGQVVFGPREMAEANKNLADTITGALQSTGELAFAVSARISAARALLPTAGRTSLAAALQELDGAAVHGRALQDLAATMNDYLDADLREVDFTEIASLDGIRWSETGTQWPARLMLEIRQSSKWLVDDVYEIQEGSSVHPL